MNYESLLQETESRGLRVMELPLTGNDGRIWKNRIAIRKDIPTTKEKACVLSEEIGHYETNYGNVMGEGDIMCRKKEHIARMNGFNRQIGLIGLIRAFENGCQSLNDIAEYLDVTGQYLNDAIECYREKYSPFIQIDNYVIQFAPFMSIQKVLLN